ncbi:hypothetical protein Glove_318g70 [Diversispora epigaea]|uniref:Uncharacterized protein n=1 Tax=Diversispora epigaea TaxID=1348612 RepID=A0A397HTI5_9GLOM|nr:hypothetical protein Glove_318g70 [Diversispora epigaea]
MSNLNELFKKKKQNPSRTSSYSRASSSALASRPSSASALRPSSASALRPSSASASRPSLFPRPLLESEDSDLTSSLVDQMNDAVTRRIFSKLDNLKTLLEKVKKNQEDMKEEIKTIKEEVAILSHDQACIDAVIIKSAQDLLEKKIYPNYDEFKESAEFFLRESDNEFFSTLGSKWEPYFEKKIRKPVKSEDSDLTSSLVDQMNDAVTRRIFSKLDNLKTLLEKVKKNQEDMKEEIKTIKEEVAILSHDQACIDAVIIKSAQDLLEKKIYPNYDEFKESAEFFLRESDNEFGLRSLRGTLCARVKTAIFENFSNMLPPISNIAKASEIAAWKKKLAVSNCFYKLFEKIEDDENDTYMTKIIKNRKIENEGFEYESDSSPTPQRPVSLERQKDPEKQIEPERNKGKKRIIEVKTLRKNLKKSKRKVENNEYEGKKNDEYEGDEGEEGEEGDEGDEGEDDDDEDDEDEEDEDEEYHNEIVNIESED